MIVHPAFLSPRFNSMVSNMHSKNLSSNQMIVNPAFVLPYLNSMVLNMDSRNQKCNQAKSVHPTFLSPRFNSMVLNMRSKNHKVSLNQIIIVHLNCKDRRHISIRMITSRRHQTTLTFFQAREQPTSADLNDLITGCRLFARRQKCHRCREEVIIRIVSSLESSRILVDVKISIRCVHVASSIVLQSCVTR